MIQVSIVCILGKGPERGGFPISYYVVCVQSSDGSRGGYITQFSHFVFCITGNQCVFDLYPQSLISCESLVTCGYSISVPDTFVMGYHTAPTYY